MLLLMRKKCLDLNETISYGRELGNSLSRNFSSRAVGPSPKQNHQNSAYYTSFMQKMRKQNPEQIFIPLMQLDLQRSARRRGTSRRFSPWQERGVRRRRRQRRLVNMTPPLLHLSREGVLFRLRRRHPAPLRRRRRLRSNGVLHNSAGALLIPPPRKFGYILNNTVLVH
jgi:hypothetical protein